MDIGRIKILIKNRARKSAGTGFWALLLSGINDIKGDSRKIERHIFLFHRTKVKKVTFYL